MSVLGMVLAVGGNWLTGQARFISGTVVNDQVIATVHPATSGHARTWVGRLLGVFLKLCGLVLAFTGVFAGVNAFLYQ